MNDRNRSWVVEMFLYLKERKAWWLLPIVLLIIAIGAFLIFTQSSVLSAFIYALW